MVDLLNPSQGLEYIDLTLGFESEKDDNEDLPCPPVRYIFWFKLIFEHRWLHGINHIDQSNSEFVH